ncbi:MAG: hypothetical protein IPM16_10475 [Chloroflexi bacterium]|nr:hypothetical protein [Chloroflexota bacterium]
MASPEVPLQIDLFTGELADTRSDHQKRRDRDRTAPQQMQMFRAAEIVGTRPRLKPAYDDWKERATIAPLVLEAEDTRTLEEVERDLMREAERLTAPMFGKESAADVSAPQQSALIFDLQAYRRAVGLREAIRMSNLPVRKRLYTTHDERGTR